MPSLPSLLFASLLTITTTLAAVNGPCSINGTPGVCLPTSQCTGSGESYQSGFCPDDPADVKCCIKPSCGSGGTCRFTSSCTGTTQSGLCPGPASFKCCTPSTGGGGGGGSSNGPHSLSANGVHLIEGFEGWSATFYTDSAGVKTIGYGHACQPSSACNSIHAPISRATGDDLLRSDAAVAVSCINKHVTVKLTQNQFDALVSFTFNLGCGALETIASKNLNAGRYAATTDEMKLYVRAGGKVLTGLVRRRDAEVKLFDT